MKLAAIATSDTSDCLAPVRSNRTACAAQLKARFPLKRIGYPALLIGLIGIVSLPTAPADACTTFLAQHDGQPVFGRNYDWADGRGLVVVNPRGLSKVAVALSPQVTPLAWTAKYASLTFNQYGVELPTGGMNEKGLVVEQMWLDETVYPPATDSRPVVNELQWIQYALDGFATVDEFAKAAQGVRISAVYASVHYLVCDAAAECAVFEYLDGQLKITRAQDMTVKTLANDTYANSVDYLDGFKGFGGDAPTPTSEESLDRFVRASSLSQTTAGTSIPTSAFNILSSVAQSEDWTKWSIVYVPKQATVHFKTHASPKIKSVSFKSFALDCPQGRKVLDIDADLTGDVTAAFLDYTNAANRALVTATLAPLSDSMPEGVVELLANYPESVTCSDTKTGSSNKSSNGGCAIETAHSAGALEWCMIALGFVTLARRRRSECRQRAETQRD